MVGGVTRPAGAKTVRPRGAYDRRFLGCPLNFTLRRQSVQSQV